MKRQPGPRLRHRLEFAFYRALATALGALPEAWALRVGALLGWLAGEVLRLRRAVVDENLGRAFPERDAEWRRRVAVESYRHLGREAVMTLRMGRASAEEVLARTEVWGLEEARLALAAGRGGVAVTGHLGNWEVGGAAMAARGFPVNAVVFRQRNPLFHEELVRTRARLGMRVLTRGQAPREGMAALRAGEPLALVADQDAGRNGVFVDFLGSPASTARGPALFCLRAEAPLYGVACLVQSQARRRYLIHVEELGVELSGEMERDVRALTQAHADFLSRFIRSAPEQYFWVHKRWKTRPSAEAGVGPEASGAPHERGGQERARVSAPGA